MKLAVSTAALATLAASCVAVGDSPSSDEPAQLDIGETADALTVARDRSERDREYIDARTVGVRTSVDWRRPRWTVYSVPRRYARFDDVAAVPADEQGPPILLSFDHYHHHGNAYIDRLLTSGHLSVFDLAAITAELERRGAALPKVPRDVAATLVDPVQPRRRCAACSEQGAPTSFPGDIDNPAASGQGGPPPIDMRQGGSGSPAGTPVGERPLLCGGEKRRGDPKDCPDFDMGESGATKLGKRFRAWFADSWTCVAACTIAIYKLAEGTQMACAIPGVGSGKSAASVPENLRRPACS